MSPVYLVILNLFGLFLIVNESLLLHKDNKQKLLVVSGLLLLSFSSLFAQEFIIGNIIFNSFYQVLTVATFGFVLFQMIITYRQSTTRYSYSQLFIEALKDLKTTVFMIVNEREQIMDISNTMLADFDMTKQQLLGKDFMTVVNQSIRFTSMNDQPIDNEYLEQYYLRFVSVFQAQKERQIVFEYFNAYDQLQTINVTEKPIIQEGKYKGRLLAGEKVTLQESTQNKIKAVELQRQLTDVQHRFEATLQIATEGLYYETEHTGEMWGNDRFKAISGLPSNVSTKTKYMELIHPNDLAAYQKQMDIKQHKKKYKVTYRLLVKKNETWVIEQGQQIQTIDGAFTVAAVQPIDQREIAKKVTLLDHVDYRVDMKRLVDSKQYFWVIRLDLNTVKDLNVEYGREATNHLVDEYIKRLKKNYQSETSKVYELDKNEYAIILQEERDTTIVHKGLLVNTGLFDYEMTLASMKLKLQPHLGIVKFPEDLSKVEDITAAAERAVMFAAKDIVKYNYCFYQDIQDVL
jgi:GGDEF domain-containing protein/PAS domain-containing protein